MRGQKPPPLAGAFSVDSLRLPKMQTLLADYTMKDQIPIFCKQRKTLAREIWLWKLLTIKDESNGAAVYYYY